MIKTWNQYIESQNTSYYSKLKFTKTEPSEEVMDILSLQGVSLNSYGEGFGSTIPLTKSEIQEINDILAPYLDTSSGHHDGIRNEVPVRYPGIHGHMNCRSGYCWFLNDPTDKYRTWPSFPVYRPYGVKLELLLNKLDNDYFIVNVSKNFHEHDDWYLVSSFNDLLRLIQEKIVELYQH